MATMLVRGDLASHRLRNSPFACAGPKTSTASALASAAIT